MKKRLIDTKLFYDTYHKNNNNKFYFKIVGKNNFTYFPIIKLIEKALSKKRINRIIDLGCGVGALDFYLANRGFSVDGVDISKRAIGIANNFKKHLDWNNPVFYLKDVTAFNNKNKYDMVLCSEVIEHVQDDIKLLNNIKNLMKKGSLGIITTPSLNAPLFKLGLLRKFDQEVGHLRRYNVQNLEKKIQNTGMKVIYTQKSEGILRNALYTLPRVGILIKFIRGPLVPIFHWIDNLSVLLFGESNIYIIFTKEK